MSKSAVGEGAMGEGARRGLTTYQEWEATVHERVQREPVWEFFGYRKSLLFYDLVWEDCERLMRDRRGKAIAEQLVRSAGSISANIEEVIALLVTELSRQRSR